MFDPNNLLGILLLILFLWVVCRRPSSRGGSPSTDYNDLQDARHWENYKEERYNPNSDDAPRH